MPPENEHAIPESVDHEYGDNVDGQNAKAKKHEPATVKDPSQRQQHGQRDEKESDKHSSFSKPGGREECDGLRNCIHEMQLCQGWLTA